MTLTDGVRGVLRDAATCALPVCSDQYEPFGSLRTMRGARRPQKEDLAAQSECFRRLRLVAEARPDLARLARRLRRISEEPAARAAWSTSDCRAERLRLCRPVRRCPHVHHSRRTVVSSWTVRNGVAGASHDKEEVDLPADIQTSYLGIQHPEPEQSPYCWQTFRTC